MGGWIRSFSDLDNVGVWFKGSLKSLKRGNVTAVYSGFAQTDSFAETFFSSKLSCIDC